MVRRGGGGRRGEEKIRNFRIDFDPRSGTAAGGGRRGGARGTEDEGNGRRQDGGSDRDEMDRTLADQYAGGHL